MLDEKGVMGLEAMGGKGVAEGVLRTVLMRDDDQARGSMVSGAGVGKRRALGRPMCPGPQVILIKGASLPATWSWIPCPVSEQRGPALCSPAVATGQCRENPSNPSEAPGSSSAVSG